uniref:PepSY domain-containing protein n=1 Tax=Sinorhizobium chiapasense TaxID=501572 RepID=UPI002FE3F383
MMKPIALALAISTLPFTVFAMPAVGDLVGTNPTDATAALEKSGCKISDFEPEGGQIEAKCSDAGGKAWEVYIDPKSGKVSQIKDGD